MKKTIINKDTRFLPVLLGTDANAYGMARSFHEAYGIKSLAFGKYPLLETRKSRIVDVHTQPDFEDPNVFLDVLEDAASAYGNTYDKLLLIACGDRYTELVCENRERLRKNFFVPYIENSLKLQLENKEDFYKICETHGLPYPATVVISKDDHEGFELPFDFPVAVKASDSIEYVLLDFPGKKKAYKADSEKELRTIINDVYGAGYTGSLIIQDFIPGDDADMYVLNSYSNAAGKVQMMCLGHSILEDYTPAGIGNYNAIIQEGNDDIYAVYRHFLETIGFEGFSNFDLKYDARDGKYKVFEINIRQGRSSFFATASGANLATWLVRDAVEGKSLPAPRLYDTPHLWVHVPKSLVLDYAPARVLPQVRRLINEGKVSNTLLYDEDLTFYRRIMINRFYHQQWKRYKEWWGKRTID